ncbi:MAG: catalase family peroxidase [Anaerolineaceae bacterium]
MATADISESLIDALNVISGPHPGFRAAHARGIVAEGTFTPTPEVSALTRAAHLQGAAVPITVRFSNAGGIPTVADSERGGRGMAIKFHLPDGRNTDLVCVSAPAFASRTPEDFLELLRLRAPDPSTGKPDMVKLGAFLAKHPETAAVLAAGAATPPRASFATTAYHALHAFRFVNVAGEGRWVRYHVAPEAGEASLTDDEAAALSEDYLQRDLRERLANGPAAFALNVQLANPADQLIDPTQPWPNDRESVECGRIVVTTVLSEQAAGDAMIWDPTNITDGIELSDDPILRVRAGAYSVSFARRRAP